MTELSLTCSGLTDLVSDYVDGTLDARAALGFETHAVYCPGCRVFVRQVQETVAGLRALPKLVAPAEDRDAVLEAFRMLH